MPPFSGRIAPLLPVLVMLLGCTSTPKTTGKSPLTPPKMSPDSCVLDIFFVRFPFDDPEVNTLMWQEIDEQHFPPQLRQRLRSNGFRVGLVDGQMPLVLSKLLELGEKPPPTGEALSTEAADLEDEPQMLRRHLQLRAGRRGEIIASGMYDRLPVLICRPDQLCGETYYQAQAMLAVKTFPQRDGRVRLELVPELHHDTAKQRWVGSQGVMRLETGRPRRVFDNMAVEAMLSPGEILVLSSISRRPGSLGHHFFTEQADRLEQKLLVIRLSQTQHDEVFCPSEVLPL